MSVARSAGAIITQRPSRSVMRFAISAAAALV